MLTYSATSIFSNLSFRWRNQEDSMYKSDSFKLIHSSKGDRQRTREITELSENVRTSLEVTDVTLPVALTQARARSL